MTEGLAAVQARVTQIQELLSPGSTTTRTSATGSVAANGSTFADVLGTTTGTDTSSTSSSSGQAAVAIASKYLGVQYKWGGTDPSTGLDCSGLTQLVYKQLGVDLPRTSAAQSTVGTAVDSIADAKPGDLVFFGSPVHHVGIYVGDGKMLNAPHTGAQVRIEKVWGTPSAIRRVLPDSGTSTTVSAAGLSLTSSVGSYGTAAGSSLTGTPYADLFSAAGAKYGVDPALLSAIAKTESGYRTSAVSSSGAQGMMQLMPSTAKSLGVDPTVPAQAIDGAARLMAANLRTFNGRVDLAVAAYDAGASAVRKYGGVPPYSETQTYVRRVTDNWGELR